MAKDYELTRANSDVPRTLPSKDEIPANESVATAKNEQMFQHRKPDGYLKIVGIEAPKPRRIKNKTSRKAPVANNESANTKIGPAIHRHSNDEKKGARTLVGRASKGYNDEALPIGTVVGFFKVPGRDGALVDTLDNRYYITYQTHVGWIDAKSVVTATNEEAASFDESDSHKNADINPRTINYKQFDNRWGAIPYAPYKDGKYEAGYSDYSVAGCCPTSLANIAVVYGKKDVTPVEAGNVALELGVRTTNKGTIGEEYYEPAAARLGLPKPEHYSKTDALKGLKTMQGKSGKYAAVNVRSAMYGSGGHYMTIYGYDGTYVYFDDPNSWNEKHNAKDFVNKHVAKGIWVF